MKTEFFLPGLASDAGYCNVRDLKENSGLRDFIDELWKEYHHLADTHFREDAQAHFLERFWEMYLAVTLLRRGYDLRPTENNAPDLCLMNEGSSIFIEATAPGRGEGPDAVQEAKHGVSRWVPEREIILRLRGAIENKHQQYKQWVKKKVIDTSSPYIIALNGRRIREAIGEGMLPFIIKTVFPFGDYKVVLDLETRKITNGFHSHRDIIHKASGSGVRTDLFELEEYQSISAVLYANCDCANHAENLGDDFTVVHNPNALNKIEHGFFPFGREYTVDGEYLRQKDWNDAESA